MHPVDGLQESTVHKEPSSQIVVFVWQPSNASQ